MGSRQVWLAEVRALVSGDVALVWRDLASLVLSWSWFGPVELALGWPLGLDASPRMKPAPTRSASPS